MSAKLKECALCGGALEEKAHVEHFQPLGRNVKVSNVALVCAKCNHRFINDEYAKANDGAWTKGFGRALADVSGADLRFVREQAKLTQAQLEAVLGLGTNTVARWETGQRDLPPYIATIVRMVALHPTSLRELGKLVAAGYIETKRPVEAETLNVRISSGSFEIGGFEKKVIEKTSGLQKSLDKLVSKKGGAWSVTDQTGKTGRSATKKPAKASS